MLYSKNGKAGILMTYSMVAIDSDMYKQLRKIAEERFDINKLHTGCKG